jgi:SAM-dependent methyltransferase
MTSATMPSDFEVVHSHLDPISVSGDPIRLHQVPLTGGQFGIKLHPVIFPSSLVMLTPRWTASRYVEFYEREYDELYRLDLRPDVGIKGIRRNASEIVDRLKRYNKDSSTIYNFLDLGAGPGYGLEVFQDFLPTSKIFVIEGSPAAQEIVRKNGFATILGSFLSDEIAEAHTESFDLIVLRHVVEHFLSPVEELKLVAKMLSKTGLAYIAVPDMMNPRTKLRDYDKWWEYWFRSVHAYYYNHNTLFKTLCMSGLAVEQWGFENEEIWCLVRRKTEHDSPFQYDQKSAFKKQVQVLNSTLPQS